jgi:hypothetical protein
MAKTLHRINVLWPFISNCNSLANIFQKNYILGDSKCRKSSHLFLQDAIG